MSTLHRKLLRDLWHLRGQVAAITVVVACGIALFVALRSMHGYLLTTQARYYEDYRFADVFAPLKQAPLDLVPRIEALPGVAAAEARIVRDVLLDVPGLAEPATGRLISIPEDGEPRLNALHVRRGRWLAPRGDRRDEVLASEAFAKANGLDVGSTVGAVINGRWQRLRIVGLALSPEYVYEIRGGADVFPDNRRFGVIWMGRRALAAAFDMEGGFNDLAVALAPGASEADVIARLDRRLARYGGLGAYGREDQVSHRFISDEITETQVTSLAIPAIFLGVTAFLLHIVLSRLVATQREQIAVLKAFGYSDASLGRHYLGLALVPVLAGSAVGSGVGLWLAAGLAQVYARFYQFPVLRFEPRPGVIVVAVLIGGGAAVAGALSAVRRAVALPPAEAMRPEAPARFRPGPLERLGALGALGGLPASGRIVLRNLERWPLRSFLSALGIALAVSILVMGRFSFDAIEAIRDVQFNRVDRADVTVVFTSVRPASALRELAHLPGVLRAEPLRAVPVRLRSGPREQRTSLLGFDPAGDLHRIVDRDLAVHPLPPGGMLLTTRLAENLGVRPGDVLTVEVFEGRRPVRRLPVAGLADELVGVSAYLEIGALHRLMEEGDAVSGAWLAVDPALASQLYTRLKRLPAVAAVGVREAALSGFQKTVAESFRISLTVLIGFASVIACGIVYNGARVALSERGRELASLRILGFSRGEVAALLFGEQAVLTLLAIPLGFALGLGVCALLAYRFESDLFRLPLVIRGASYLFAFLVVAGAALLSGLAVRRRLDRLDLVEVLKTRE